MSYVLAALLILSLGGTPLPKLGFHTYKEACARAMKNERPLVVLITATGCSPCQRMKRSALPEANRSGLLNRVELGLVDVEKRPKLAGVLMKGCSTPQMLVYWRYKGKWWQWRFIGYRSSKQIRAILKTVLEQNDAEKKRNRRSVPPAVRSSGVPRAATTA